MGGGDKTAEGFNKLEIASASKMDPATERRQQHLWKEAERMAGSGGFQSQYGMFPGMSSMGQAGQSYLTGQILGPDAYGGGYAGIGQDGGLGYGDWQRPADADSTPFDYRQSGYNPGQTFGSYGGGGGGGGEGHPSGDKGDLSLDEGGGMGTGADQQDQDRASMNIPGMPSRRGQPPSRGTQPPPGATPPGVGLEDQRGPAPTGQPASQPWLSPPVPPIGDERSDPVGTAMQEWNQKLAPIGQGIRDYRDSRIPDAPDPIAAPDHPNLPGVQVPRDVPSPSLDAPPGIAPPPPPGGIGLGFSAPRGGPQARFNQAPPSATGGDMMGSDYRQPYQPGIGQLGGLRGGGRGAGGQGPQPHTPVGIGETQEAADAVRRVMGQTGPGAVRAREVGGPEAVEVDEFGGASTLGGPSVEQYLQPAGVEAQVSQAEHDYERALAQEQSRQAAAGAFGSRGSVEESGLREAQQRNIAQIRGAGFDRAAQMMESDAARRQAAGLQGQQLTTGTRRGEQALQQQAREANQRAALEAARYSQLGGQDFSRQQLAAAAGLGGLGSQLQQQTFGAGEALMQMGGEQDRFRQAQQAFDYEQWLRGQEGGAEALGLVQSMMPGGQQQQWQRKPSKTGQILGGLLAAGGTAAQAFGSDIRMKENVKLVGNQKGFNMYEFNYLGSDQRYKGVMAHEVAKRRPEAVIEVNGLYWVDYGALGLEMEVV